MYNYKKSLNMEPRSSSKRWQTTTQSALIETATAIRNMDRNAMVEDMRSRKTNNTKSSINFGNNKIDYVSDMMDNQRRCQSTIDPVEREAQKVRNRIMKAELTTTNFSLGDDKPEYESINHMAMAEANHFEGGRAHIFSDLKEAIKKSSITFGREPTNYTSIAHEAMEYKGNPYNFEQIRKEIKTMKANLRKHNFNLGEEPIEYQSDYQRGYGSIGQDHYKAAGQHRDAMRAIKADLRATHWVFGNEKVDYISDTHEALKLAEGKACADEVQKNIARAKQMKLELQKTSYVIGNDAEYH